ncbi:MAG: hypothetical protein UD961_10805 [Bacteroidales bacterium]|nr:hypothetical protein [Bacteroidales bacterium]
MEAERLYTKQPSRTIQQKRGGEGARVLNFVEKSKITQLKTCVFYKTMNFTYETGKTEDIGYQVDAYLDSKDPRRGSEPSTSALKKTTTALKNEGYQSIIKGHLLNGLLGGPGIAKNLFPITPQANHLHLLHAENHVKNYLSRRRRPRGIMYSVKVDNAKYTYLNPSCEFRCEAYPWIVSKGANKNAVNTANPIFYPVKIESRPQKGGTGKGNVLSHINGINALGIWFDYGKKYKQPSSLSFKSSLLPNGWGSLGKGGARQKWEYFKKL